MIVRDLRTLLEALDPTLELGNHVEAHQEGALLSLNEAGGMADIAMIDVRTATPVGPLRANERFNSGVNWIKETVALVKANWNQVVTAEWGFLDQLLARMFAAHLSPETITYLLTEALMHQRPAPGAMYYKTELAPIVEQAWKDLPVHLPPTEASFKARLVEKAKENRTNESFDWLAQDMLDMVWAGYLYTTIADLILDALKEAIPGDVSPFETDQLKGYCLGFLHDAIQPLKDKGEKTWTPKPRSP